MIIPKNKKSKCPICHKVPTKPNGWVKYHITYKPPKVILACKYCNYIEWGLRTSHDLSYHRFAYTPYRVMCVIAFQKRFGVKL